MDERINELQFEINALKSLLRDSDYQIIKLAEDMTDCTTITGFVKLFKEFLEKFGELVKNRRAWRAKINELETEIAAIDTTELSISDTENQADAEE